jgi:hypothetical protein
MTQQTYPLEFLKLLESVDAKRPKTVIDHILKHGQITTEDLKNTYGFRWKKDCGIQIRRSIAGSRCTAFRQNGILIKTQGCAHRKIRPKMQYLSRTLSS